MYRLLSIKRCQTDRDRSVEIKLIKLDASNKVFTNVSRKVKFHFKSILENYELNYHSLVTNVYPTASFKTKQLTNISND